MGDCAMSSLQQCKKQRHCIGPGLLQPWVTCSPVSVIRIPCMCLSFTLQPFSDHPPLPFGGGYGGGGLGGSGLGARNELRSAGGITLSVPKGHTQLALYRDTVKIKVWVNSSPVAEMVVPEQCTSSSWHALWLKLVVFAQNAAHSPIVTGFTA